MPSIGRDQMEAHIDAGGSVMLPTGQVVTHKDHLPTHAATAGSDPEDRERIRQRLLARRDAIDAELDDLSKPPPPPRRQATHDRPVRAKAPAAKKATKKASAKRASRPKAAAPKKDDDEKK